MNRIINVEKAEYINKNIAIYTKNRIGQYSKFLDKNPIFVTYYHINKQNTRVDAGTMNIESELGPRSPIRFNKISSFPVYNIPELRPDLIYDETGMDIDLELSDIVILPKTIKPNPNDYMIVHIPGAVEYLFRVNNVKYNTIQSNDFYMIDLDIKDIGNNLEVTRGIDKQIVDDYYTVFDNIGTSDNCFVNTLDIPRLNNLFDLIETLKEWYKNAFYETNLNSFTIRPVVDLFQMNYIYDPYLEAFINKSNIYYEENVSTVLVLVPNDNLPAKFNNIFNTTLYQAILSKNLEFLRPYHYMMSGPPVSDTSLYSLFDYPTDSVGLMTSNTPVANTGQCNAQWYSYIPLPSIVPVNNCSPEYFSGDFIKSIMDGNLNTDNYLEAIIYWYLTGEEFEVDRSEIISALDENSISCFRYIPIIIYILKSIYNEYFKIDQHSFLN